MDLWCPFAVPQPGPPWKQGYSFATVNLAQGVVLHSMVGSYEAARSRLMGEDRVSWHFSVRKDGTILQHYPVRTVCWHAGSPDANQRYVGVEHEGGAAPDYGEPLTDAQRSASIRLVLWLMRELRWSEFRVGVQGMEHNWLWPTACPSGRIPWAEYVRAVSEEGKVDQELRDRIRVASAFEAAVAAILAGRDLRTALSQEQLDTIRYILRVAGIV